MERFQFRHQAARRAEGDRGDGIVGVVGSGNCEVLLERVLDGTAVEIDVATASVGFGKIWQLVVERFVERASPGGLRLSINDGGATPDVVTLRLLQGTAMMEGRS